MFRFTILIALLTGFTQIMSQQIADLSYLPVIARPAYDTGKGFVIYIDEGHHNFHTREGRYKAFARLLERDGYRVKSYLGKFIPEELEKGKILVISNALHSSNVKRWINPCPSAFSESEIETIHQWVLKGGALLLIADHMPMGGAAMDLAKVFGFEFTNGFVLDTTNRGPAIFSRSDGSLKENEITNGNSGNNSVNQIATFTGQGFLIPKEAAPVLEFDHRFVNVLPDTAWVFNTQTKQISAAGMYQGAYRTYGKGRVYMSGEAAMFAAQLAGPNKSKMGMNNPVANENYQLLLNIIHWLDGKQQDH